MLEKFIIAFFAFFLTSRFFSEIVGIFPKWVDILDIPVCGILVAITLWRLPNAGTNLSEHRYLVRSIVIFSLAAIGAALVNVRELLAPAAILFLMGCLQGPLLFVSLNKVSDDVERFSMRIVKFFLVLLAVNFAIVLLIDLPIFLRTGDPDSVSGTYGLNAYQFSFLLIVCGGLLLGEEELHQRSRFRIILGQACVLVIFYMLQYRAAVPFFVLAYALMLLALYGRRIAKVVTIGALVLTFASSGIYFLLNMSPDDIDLKYDDWALILSQPYDYLQYGKFQAYPQTLQLMIDRPTAILAGVGPGNFLSRAYYTFSFEMAGSKSKGVGDLVEKLFGLDGPRFTEVSENYLGPIRTGAVLGSYQFSNPHSSFLAPIAEIGLIGGGVIIAMYLYMVIRSFKLLRQAKEHAREFLPIATALVAGSIYLFCLAFLDNYWEQSRATLPVWLLFWGTSAGVQCKINRTLSERDEREGVELEPNESLST